MKNKFTEALKIVVLFNLLLLGYSIINPRIHIPLPGGKDTLDIKFPSFRELTEIKVIEENKKAEDLIGKYLENGQNDEAQTGDAAEENQLLINKAVKGKRPLDNFFRALESAGGSRTLRIAHYGDSQIEGDRITQLLRGKFQQKFGGSGIGYVPLADITNHVTITRTSSKNWIRYTVFSNKYGGDKYALSGMMFRFSKAVTVDDEDSTDAVEESPEKEEVNPDEKPAEEVPDTSGQGEGTVAPGADTTSLNLSGVKKEFVKTGKKQKQEIRNSARHNAEKKNIKEEQDANGSGGTVNPPVNNIFLPLTELFKQDDSTKVKKKTLYFDKASVEIRIPPGVSYSRLGLMYGKVPDDCKIEIYDYSKRKKIYSGSLTESRGFNIMYFDLPRMPDNFRIDFKADKSPDLYGLMFEGGGGIQVDNYGIRGHAGIGLELIDPDYLAMQYRQLNTKLLILQYGANAAPYVKSEKTLKEITEMYEKLFRTIRKVAPDISVLVIGPGDMSLNKGGRYIALPYQSRLKNAIKKAAEDNGCAFFDTYEMMGGENSILTWSSKGLSAKDGHFLGKGQEILSKQVFDALMAEFEKYKERKN